uniref:Uncharacterized protein n=1 Tax=Nyctotherus ovalis TaxID=70075 RepID=Q5DUY2_NYCOV|nr:hypothetical protein [Nyctotherus ovalis]
MSDATINSTLLKEIVLYGGRSDISVLTITWYINQRVTVGRSLPDRFGVGLHKQIFQEYIRQTMWRYTHKYLTANRPTSIEFYLIGATGQVYLSNIEALHTVLYRFYILLYNSGSAQGRFMTYTSEALQRDAIALNYYVATIWGRRRFLRERFNRDGGAFTNFLRDLQYQEDVDFILIISGNLTNSDLIKLNRLTFPTIGLVTDLIMTRYVDITIPLESDSLAMQHYFLEFSLYAYIHGRRAQLLSSQSLSQTRLAQLNAYYL